MEGYRWPPDRGIVVDMAHPHTSAVRPSAPAPAPRRRRSGWAVRSDGGSPVEHIGPNWFASVMGTGIVANAAATLPVSGVPVLGPALLALAEGVWVLAAALLVVVTAATALHWWHHPETARGHLSNPIMSHFYGAPAMALMTVGAGALLVGQPLLGPGVALAVAWTLWTMGTAMGLWTAVVIPYRAFTRRRADPDAAFGGWLMPVVPPMVSAATGPLLIDRLPAGEAAGTLLLACYAMFGLTAIASVIMITMIWQRLVHHTIGAAATVPTLWIVLGPLGQSITAAHNLGEQAPDLLPAPYGTAFQAFGLVYGMPVWGFALLWLALAVAITVRTVRTGLPFGLTWWSFTFPVGTMVTGTSGLAAATGSTVLTVLAVLGWVGLVLAWVTVAVRTGRGVWRGDLLRAP